jgi:uncharacterized protein (TIGR00304 family)
LVLSGILIVILAFFLAYFRRGEGGKIRGGGAVIIGPIPIVFGTDKKALKIVLSLSVVLTLLLLTAMIVGYLLR